MTYTNIHTQLRTLRTYIHKPTMSCMCIYDELVLRYQQGINLNINVYSRTNTSRKIIKKSDIKKRQTR